MVKKVYQNPEGGLNAKGRAYFKNKEGGGGIESASGTAMRKHATAGDKESFHKMAPSGMSKAHKDELYHDVRKGMGIHESFIARFKNWIN